jgi:hypothetical protein
MIMIVKPLSRSGVPAQPSQVRNEPVTRGTTMTDLNVNHDDTNPPDPTVTDPWDTAPNDPPPPVPPVPPDPPEPDPPVTNPWDTGPNA